MSEFLGVPLFHPNSMSETAVPLFERDDNRTVPENLTLMNTSDQPDFFDLLLGRPVFRSNCIFAHLFICNLRCSGRRLLSGLQSAFLQPRADIRSDRSWLLHQMEGLPLKCSTGNRQLIRILYFCIFWRSTKNFGTALSRRTSTFRI
jgi:hypothetical protein